MKKRRIKISKPYIHAKSSARRYGGVPEDYMDIHEEMDATKSALADVRHRAILHSAYGIYIVQRIFGQTRTNSEGKVYSVRDIAEQHILEDLGRIPSLQDWMEGVEIKPWMMGKKEVKNVVNIPFNPPPTSAVPIKLPVQPTTFETTPLPDVRNPAMIVID